MDKNYTCTEQIAILNGLRYQLLLHDDENRFWDTIYVYKPSGQWEYWVGPTMAYMALHASITPETKSMMKYLEAYMNTGLYLSVDLATYIGLFE